MPRWAGIILGLLLLLLILVFAINFFAQPQPPGR